MNSIGNSNTNFTKYQPSNLAQPKYNNIVPFRNIHRNDLISFSGKATNSEKEAKINEIVKTIKNAKKVAILTHVSADGDAVGSLAAMRELVAKQKNVKKVEAFIVGNIPENFKSLEDTKSFQYITKKTPGNILNEKYDLVITVDAARKYMLANAAKIFDNADKTIKIDHHPDSEDYAKINLVDENASSASQVIKELVKPLGVKLTKNIASDLYLALLTDTQGFRFPKDPVKAFEDATDLSKTGIDVQNIYRNCMDRISKPLLDVYTKALQNIEFSNDGSIAYYIQDQETQKTYPEEVKSDRAGAKEVLKKIYEIILPNIKGVKASMMLNETFDGATTASLRGRNIPVNDIAKQFGGGGHEFAAGCKINEKPEKALEILLKAFQEKKERENK